MYYIIHVQERHRYLYHTIYMNVYILYRTLPELNLYDRVIYIKICISYICTVCIKQVYDNSWRSKKEDRLMIRRQFHRLHNTKVQVVQIFAHSYDSTPCSVHINYKSTLQGLQSYHLCYQTWWLTLNYLGHLFFLNNESKLNAAFSKFNTKELGQKNLSRCSTTESMEGCWHSGIPRTCQSKYFFRNSQGKSNSLTQ